MTVQTQTMALPTSGGLPLRQDQLLTSGLVLKVMLVLIVLTILTYVLLRWYARLNGRITGSGSDPELLCVATLRISPRTRVFLLRSGGSELVVTESASSTEVTLLPRPAATGSESWS